MLLETPEGEVALKNDFVFAMTGTARIWSFWTRTASRFDPETRRPRTRSGDAGERAQGDVSGGRDGGGMHTNEIFIENGRFHGKKIAEAIASLT